MRIFLFFCLVVVAKLWSYDQFVVSNMDSSSYGHGYSDYLRLLHPEYRRTLCFCVSPNGVECLHGMRVVAPLGSEDAHLSIEDSEKFCRLLATRSPRFATKLRSWHRRGLIVEPFLQNIARDVSSTRPLGGG